MMGLRAPAMWLGLVAAGLAMQPVAAFNILWPTPVYQCASNHLTWTGGTPPFKIVLAPVFQVPFVYNVPASAYSDGKGSYNIQMQMGSGTRYVLFMMDATGMGSSMTTSMDTVQGYDQSACLSSEALAANSTGLPFSFQVFQRNIVQCETTFNMTWTLDNNITGPYNMTVMSLTQAFLPFDLYVGNTSAFDWQVNLPAGDDFTVMMNSPLGYGRGGVASTYQVNSTATGNTGCLSVEPTTTGQPAGATSTGGSGNMGDGDQSGSGGNPAGGSGKGVTIGAALGSAVTVAAIALLAGAIWWWRRRRQAKTAAPTSGGYGDDAMGGRRRRPYDPDAPDLLGSSDRLGGDYRGGISRAGTFDTVPSSDPDRDEAHSPWAESPASRMGAYPLPPSWPGGSRSSDSNRSNGDYQNPFETPQPESPSEAAEFGSGGRGAQGYVGRGSNRERDGRPSYSASDLTGGTGTYSGAYTGLESVSRRGSAAGFGSGLGSVGQTSQARLAAKYEDETAEAIALATLPSSRTAGAGPPALITGQLGGGGGFRITNAGEGDPLPPASPVGAAPGPAGRQNTRRGTRRPLEPGMEAQPRFRRHADAGRVDGAGEVIDLPPMYTDIVPVGEPEAMGEGDPDGARDDDHGDIGARSAR